VDDGRAEWVRRLVEVAMASDGALSFADLWARPLPVVAEILEAVGYILEARARAVERLRLGG
jgi:hypothetical protein